MNLQPIETAPTDGTWILLSGGRTDEDFCMEDNHPSDLSRAVTGKWFEGEWVFSFWDGAWRGTYCCPKYWADIT